MTFMRANIAEMREIPLVDQGSPEWREMLGKALELIASAEGGLDVTRVSRKRVYDEIVNRPDAEERLRLAINLADAAISVAHVGIRLLEIVVDDVDLDEVDFDKPVDIARTLRMIEKTIEEMPP